MKKSVFLVVKTNKFT